MSLGFTMADLVGAFSPLPENSKPLVKSKTLIVNAIIALAALYPPAAAFVATHPVVALQIIAYANILLRLVTHQRVALYRAE